MPPLTQRSSGKSRSGSWGLVAIHQLGNPENRKRAHEFDYHERYNAKVDALTHKLTFDMPLYVPFKRMGRVRKRDSGTGLSSGKMWAGDAPRGYERRPLVYCRVSPTPSAGRSISVSRGRVHRNGL